MGRSERAVESREATSGGGGAVDVEEEWITKVEEVTSEGRREVEEARAMPQAGEEEEHGVEQRWLVRGREAVRAAASQCFRVRRHNIRAPRDGSASVQRFYRACTCRPL